MQVRSLLWLCQLCMVVVSWVGRRLVWGKLVCGEVGWGHLAVSGLGGGDSARLTTPILLSVKVCPRISC